MHCYERIKTCGGPGPQFRGHIDWTHDMHASELLEHTVVDGLEVSGASQVIGFNNAKEIHVQL
jgi:hypothetical protein